MAYTTRESQIVDHDKSFDLLCDRKWRDYHAMDGKRDFPCKHGHFNCSTIEHGPCCDEQYAHLTDRYGPDTES